MLVIRKDWSGDMKRLFNLLLVGVLLATSENKLGEII